VELVVALAVILVLGAIASPQLMKALRSYELNDSATRLAGMLKLTRFEAIRNNRNSDLRFQQNGTAWTVWKDTNTNGTPDTNETQMVLGGYADMLPAGAVPNTAPITATLGGGGALALTTLSGANGAVRFDARGAISFPGAPTVYVFYLGSATDADPGYRAVLVMPAGATQIWRTSAAGDWQRTS
jgi:type II secretory pathway pseudopilin PulG